MWWVLLWPWRLLPSLLFILPQERCPHARLRTRAPTWTLSLRGQSTRCGHVVGHIPTSRELCTLVQKKETVNQPPLNPQAHPLRRSLSTVTAVFATG